MTQTLPRRGAAISDFGIDTTAMSTSEVVRDYFARLRAGQLGSLPALLGLVVLVAVFATLSDVFLSLNNLANLLAQGAGQTIIAMGIVFVLLVGEIDLSAGTASGVTAAVLAMHFVEDGNLLGGMGSTVFILFNAVLALAAVLAMLLRIWAGAVISVLGIGLPCPDCPPTRGWRCCSRCAWGPRSGASPDFWWPGSGCRRSW